MTVATPLSLNNIKYEFGNTKAQSLTTSGSSGSVTAPSGATSLKITLNGGGGGSDASYTGGDGGLLVKNNISVTGGSTSLSYTVGSAGANSGYVYDEYGSTYVPSTAGGDTTVIVNSVTYTAYGGGAGEGSNGSNGGTTGNGDVNTTGGGAAGADGLGNTAISGSISLEWGFGSIAKLSPMTRGGGFIPNHAQNSNIPTTTSGLGIGDFSGTSLNFTATVSDSPGGQYGYEYGVFGTIDRDQFGISRTNTNTRTLYAITQSRSIFYDLFGAPSFYFYSISVKFLGDMRISTLGYNPVSYVGVKPSGGAWSYVSLLSDGLNSINPSYDGTFTTYTNSLAYSGSLSGDNWLFAAGTNEVEIGFNTIVRYDTIATQTITSGEYPFLGPAPLQAPVGAEAVTIRVWGGGAGGTGGQGGGGASYSEVINAPINSQERFIYTVGVGGAPGANGNTTSITSNTNIFTGIYAEGGFANGSGGMVNPSMGLFNPWSFYFGTNANGSSTGTSNGAAAGGAGGGAGGVGAAGVIPGGGGASGFSGARGEIQIEWKASVPIPGNY